MQRSNGWKKSLALAVFFSTFGGGFTMSVAVAQETTQSERERVIVEDVDASNYRDDRSTPPALIASYYNAINRKEYARAYSYHPDGDFDDFIKGYKKAKRVRLALRNNAEIDRGVGASYAYQPLAIEAESEDGKKEVFGGCYKIYVSDAFVLYDGPFVPMTIANGSLKKSSLPLEKSVPKSCDPT